MGTVFRCLHQVTFLSTMRPCLILATLLCLGIPALSLKLNQVHTTFGLLSDRWPMTRDELESSGYGYVLLNELRCEAGGYVGWRYVPDPSLHGTPNVVLMYGSSPLYGGPHIAGMQSLVPKEDFIDPNQCTDNPYYTIETIAGKEYCVLTMYFQHPETVCDFDGADKEKNLYLQKGNNPNWIRNQQWIRVWDTMLNVQYHFSTWNVDKYFPGMGFHTTRVEDDPEDCRMAVPIQGLYAHMGLFDDADCFNTGFVFVHYNTKTTGHGWEKPGSTPVSLILNKPSQCQLDAADKSLVTSMHVFLGGSTL